MIDSESQWHAMGLEGCEVAIVLEVGDSVLYHLLTRLQGHAPLDKGFAKSILDRVISVFQPH
jgi:hypothetical protein